MHMNDFTYRVPTRFVFGRGVVDEVGEALAEAGYGCALVVYGKGSAVRTGTLDRVLASLDRAGVRHAQLGGVRPNPEVGAVRDGVAAARADEADVVLAVGGGSAIDTAKAIAVGVPYEGDVWDLFMKKAQVVSEGKLPVACVLTIPAAGSEASSSCVISNDGLSLKKGLSTELHRPVLAFMDPELTFTLPAYQTAAGITDMCAHIMERFFGSTGPCPVTDQVACGLVRSLIECAPRVLDDPCDYDARASIMWAGTQAHNGLCGLGRAAKPNGRAGGWESHALEHELSAHDPAIAHGAGLAVVMPAWMRYVWRSAPERWLTFGRLVFDIEPVDVVEDCIDATPGEAEEDAVLAVIDEIQAFFCSMGMPRTLGELGVTAEDVPALLDTLRQNKGDVIGELQPLSIDDCRAIYESCL